MNDHDPHETTATLLALTARGDDPDAPAFTVSLGDATTTSTGGQLADALDAAGIRVAHVLTRPGWEDPVRRTFGGDVSIIVVADHREAATVLTATETHAPLLLAPAHAFVPAFQLRSLVKYPARTPAVLLLDASADGRGLGVSVNGGIIDGFRDADAMSGVVWLPEGPASSAADPVHWNPDDDQSDRPSADLLVGGQVVAATLAGGDDVRAVSPRHATVDLIADAATADLLVARREAGPGDDDARMYNSVKEWDGWFTTFFVSPVTQHVARFLGRRNASPNSVTTASLIVALAAAALLFVDGALPMVVAAVLLQLSFALDCVDGQLARYSARFSRLGAYFDVASDRVKEYAVMLAMAWTVGSTSVWFAAAAAFALQTMRHSRNVAYESASSAPETDSPSSVVAAVARRDRDRRETGLRYWARRLSTFSIGERLAVLSLGMAFGANEVALWTYVAWVALASMVQILGRRRRPGHRRRLGPRDVDLGLPVEGKGSAWRGADVALLAVTAGAAFAVDSSLPTAAVVPLWLVAALVLALHLQTRSAAIVSLVDFAPALVLLGGDRAPEPLGCLAAVLAVMWADRSYVASFSVSMPRVVSALRLGVIPRQTIVLVAASAGLATEAAIGLVVLLGSSLVWGWIVVMRQLAGPREDQNPAVSLP